MPAKKSHITITDQFCGAGGSSQGVRRYSERSNGGVEVKLALNHWKLAIETHASQPSDALGTCKTHDAHFLINYDEPRIEDCYYRMLKAHELKLAMAFDKEYVVLGSSKNQVKQLGNAVTPPAMEWLIGRAVESLS